MAADEPIKPHWSYLLGAGLVIAACLVMASMSCAMVFSGDACLLITGPFYLVPSVILGVCQYRGAFRRDRNCAALLGVVMAILGVGAVSLPVMIAVSLTVESIAALGEFPWEDIWDALALVTIPSLLVGAVAGGLGWMNLRWSRRLLAVRVSEGPKKRFRFSLSELLALTATAACGMALTSGFHAAKPSSHSFAEHLTAEEVPYVPPGASDVCYSHRSRGPSVYEFTIDEAAFLAWGKREIGTYESKAAGAKLKSIVGVFTITRYCPSPATPGVLDTAVVSDGWCYDFWCEDRVIRAAYDRKTQRAYVYKCFN